MQKKYILFIVLVFSLLGLIGTSSANPITSESELVSGNVVVAVDHLDGNGDDAGFIMQVTSFTGNSTVAPKPSVLISSEEISKSTHNETVRFSGDNLIFDSVGNLYFTEAASVSVLRRGVDGTLTVLATNDQILALTEENDAVLEGLTVGYNGLIYVSEGISNKILEIDPITRVIKIFTSEDTFDGLVGSFDIEMGPVATSEGKMYVATSGTSGNISVASGGGQTTTSVRALPRSTVISELDKDGNATTVVTLGTSSPKGRMTTAPNDDLIVADDVADTIYRITPPDGIPEVFISEKELEDILGDEIDLSGPIAFDDDGNFYLATDSDDDGEIDDIYRWDVEKSDDGTNYYPEKGYLILPELLVLTSLEIDNFNFSGGVVVVPDQGRTPDPTPEPSTIILFVTGLVGVVGLRGRHRKKP